MVPATALPDLRLTSDTEKKNRATGAWKSPGYRSPCPGGRGNRYFAVLEAVDATKKVPAKAKIGLGRC